MLDVHGLRKELHVFAMLAAAAMLLAPGSAPPPPHEPDPFAGAPELTPEALVSLVLERNPDVAAMSAAAEAAASRPQQVGALDDPMLTWEVAPLSVYQRDVPFGTQVRLSQKFPFPGKRGLRASEAEAEAKSMRAEVHDVRRELRGMALEAWADWYLAARELEINAAHGLLLSELKRAAEAQYGVGRAAQQDPLQAEVMIAELEQERAELERRQRLVRGRINALVHRPMAALVPPPPREVEVAQDVPPDALERAREHRPELAALDARIEGARANEELAAKAWLPDFELMASYSTMWPEPPMRFMAGVGVEIPLQLGRRSGERAEAGARRRQLELTREHRAQEIENEAHAAREELSSALAVLKIQSQRVMAAARAQLDSARAGYVAGRNEFQALIEAERSLRNAELRRQRAIADVVRRRAALESAMGEDR
ncbi:MAG TPA: TolC family protein [Myxococcaceae bacterium]|nr:TolC family protein [Myxococcaceae bacterium]